MENKESKKSRIAIFSFYDKAGIVDKYIEIILTDLLNITSELIIVCNGKITEKGLRIFNKYTDKVIIREEEGYEVGAWKKALLENEQYIKENYDEVILLDDSFYGPFTPFQEIVSDMERKTCNFWGLSVQYKSRDIKGIELSGYIPTHINTSFTVIRKRMLNDNEFWKYWKNVELPTKPNDEFSKHEIYFTNYFEKHKFSWACYADMESCCYTDDKNYNLALYNQYDLITKYKYPILNRKPFGFIKGEHLRYGLGNDLKISMEYIDKYLKYSIDYIWENIIRVFNNADLFSSLDLTYVLPSQGEIQKDEGTKSRKIAVVMHMFYPDIFEYCTEYSKSIPADADVYVTTNTDEKCQIIDKMMRPLFGERLTVLNCGNRGRDVAALIVTCRKYLMNYDYLCFVHDKKSSHLNSMTGASYQDTLWDNMLKSQYYVEQIIDLFDKNKHLGLLSAPGPHVGAWFGIIANTWTSSFDVTKQLYDKLGLTVDIDPAKRAVALGTVFWCRPIALKQLFEYPWKYEDFPEEPMGLDATLGHAVERIIAFVAQENGYYTGWVLNDQYATLELSNLQGMTDMFVTNAILHQGLNYCEGYMEFIRCLNNRLELADRLSQQQSTNKIKRCIIKLMPNSLYQKLCKIKYRMVLFKENKSGK